MPAKTKAKVKASLQKPRVGGETQALAPVLAKLQDRLDQVKHFLDTELRAAHGERSAGSWDSSEKLVCAVDNLCAAAKNVKDSSTKLALVFQVVLKEPPIAFIHENSVIFPAISAACFTCFLF